MFDDFRKTHNRGEYGSDSEKRLRYRMFKRSIEEVDMLNSEPNGTVVYGITDFMDWTDEECSNLTGKLLKDKDDEGLYRSHGEWSFVQWDGSQYPTYFDWRTQQGTTPIKSQTFKCNSCWAFAVTAVVESLYKIAHKTTVSLSEAEMVDCDHTNNGCISGSTRRAMYRGKFHGFSTTQTYPNIQGWSAYCPAYGEVKVNKLYALTPDEHTLAWFISHHGPVALNVAFPSQFKYYKSGVLRSTYECETMEVNHAVEAVGFGEEYGIKYWILKNSWGDWWGDHGYFKMERGRNTCQIETLATSAGVA